MIKASRLDLDQHLVCLQSSDFLEPDLNNVRPARAERASNPPTINRGHFDNFITDPVWYHETHLGYVSAGVRAMMPITRESKSLWVHTCGDAPGNPYLGGSAGRGPECSHTPWNAQARAHATSSTLWGMAAPTDEVWKKSVLAATYLEGVRGAVPLAAEQLDIVVRLVADGSRPMG